MVIHHHEFTGECASEVDVRRVRLETFFITQDLSRGSSGHGSHEETVSKSLGFDTLTHRVPIVASTELGLTLPHVRLKNTLRRRRPFETLIRPLDFSEFGRRLEGRVVHRLEDVGVHETRLFTVEGETTKNKHVSETLNTETDGTVFHVRSTGSFDRVEITVDDTVQVLRDSFGDFMKLLVVERLRLFVHVLGKGDGREITHGCLILVGILQNFSTQVGTLDDPQVFLVTLGVTRILVQHVWCSSLRLTLQNRLPHVGGGNGRVGETLLFILGVKFLKIFTVTIGETFSLVRAKERPVTTFFDTLHEKIGDPHSREEIATPRFFITL